MKTQLNFKVIVDNKVQVNRDQYKGHIQGVCYGQHHDTTQGKGQLQGQYNSKVTVKVMVLVKV